MAHSSPGGLALLRVRASKPSGHRILSRKASSRGARDGKRSCEAWMRPLGRPSQPKDAAKDLRCKVEVIFQSTLADTNGLLERESGSVCEFSLFNAVQRA